MIHGLFERAVKHEVSIRRIGIVLATAVVVAISALVLVDPKPPPKQQFPFLELDEHSLLLPDDEDGISKSTIRWCQRAIRNVYMVGDRFLQEMRYSDSIGEEALRRVIWIPESFAPAELEDSIIMNGTYPMGGVMGRLSADLSHVAMAFRGTQNVLDMAADVATTLDNFVPDRALTVSASHPGTARRVGEVVHDISVRDYGRPFQRVLEAMEGVRRVTVCGHSMGSWVAFCSAVYIAENCRDISVRCVLFACPNIIAFDETNLPKNLVFFHLFHEEDPVVTVLQNHRFKNAIPLSTVDLSPLEQHGASINEDPGNEGWDFSLLGSSRQPLEQHGASINEDPGNEGWDFSLLGSSRQPLDRAGEAEV